MQNGKITGKAGEEGMKGNLGIPIHLAPSLYFPLQATAFLPYHLESFSI